MNIEAQKWPFLYRNNQLRDMLKNAEQQAALAEPLPHQSQSPLKEELESKPKQLDIPSLDGVDGSSAVEPSDLYEVYRRRLQRDARELWRYLNSQLEELAKHSNLANNTLWDTRSRYHVIMSDIGKITTNIKVMMLVQ